MRGFSAVKPEINIKHGGGWQHRYNIEQIERETDEGPITEWQFDYVNVPHGPETDAFRKTVRDHKTAEIIVTTASGKAFDGDEESQERMARAIKAAEITGLVETEWKMADNSKQVVTLQEMSEALALALQQQSVIWFA